MCDPMTATAVALSAGGSFLEAREANKNQKRITNAKNNVYQQNMRRQEEYAAESTRAFNENLEKQGREGFDDQAGEEKERFTQAFGSRRTNPDYTVGTVASAPRNVILSRQRESDEATAETDRDVDALSSLQGFTGAGFNQGLSRNEFARAFGNLSDKAIRDSNLLGLDLQQAANNANRAPSLFPTLLKAAGSGLGMYGAAGGTFGNTLVEGPLPLSGIGPGAPVVKPGLFTQARTGFGRAFGGL